MLNEMLDEMLNEMHWVHHWADSPVNGSRASKSDLRAKQTIES